jgi:FkbM family methyltransferase
MKNGFRLFLQSFVRPVFWRFRRYLKAKLTRATAVPSSNERGRVIAVRVQGIEFPVSVRKGTSDGAVLAQCLIETQYDFDPNFEPKVILDLGANIGCAAVYFANRWPNAKIVSVEPVLDNFRMLVSNVRMYSNVVPIHAAINHADGDVVISVPGTDFWAASVRAKGKSDGNAHTVRGITIDTLLKENRLELIDIVKIDIEGSEVDVFSRGPLNWLMRTRLVVIELHDGLRSGCSWYFEKAISRYPLKRSRIGENDLIWFTDQL